MYAHDNWTSNGTILLRQINSTGAKSFILCWRLAPDTIIDAGTFQVSRKGVNIIETMGYSRKTVKWVQRQWDRGYGDRFAHNQPLVGGQASINVFGGCADGPGSVKRLETQAGYAFAATDLTLTYQNNVCDSGHPERQNPGGELRSAGLLLFPRNQCPGIRDRFVAFYYPAARSTTFVSHCETNPVVASATIACVTGQEALYTAPVP